MTSLAKTEWELRRAVESKRYGDVERLAVDYGNLARATLSALPPGSPEMQETQIAVQQMLAWANWMLQAGRESIALELNRLPRVKRYLQTPAADRTNWRAEG